MRISILFNFGISAKFSPKLRKHIERTKLKAEIIAFDAGWQARRRACEDNSTAIIEEALGEEAKYHI